MAVALVVCLFAFVLLAAGEAWAAEQPSKTTQPGPVQSTTTINGKVAEPAPGATKPPVVVTPPVEKPAAEDPAPPPPRNEIPPAKEPSPLPPTNETPPAEEPTPPQSGPAPSTPEPEVAAPQPTPQPAPRPVPQRFTATTDGEAVDSAPLLTTSQSVTDFSRVLEPKPMTNDDSPDVTPDVTPGVTDPAPAPAAPAGAAAAADDGYASGPAPDPVLIPVPGPSAASEQVLPAASGLAGLVRGLVAEPALPWRDGDDPHGVPPRTPANPTVVAGLTPSTPVQTVPASVRGALHLPSSVGTTAASAVGTVQSAVASATAEVLGTLTGGLTESSATGTQEDQPSEGTPEPAPPLAPPTGGGGSFSPFTGGGQLGGTGGGSTPLLVGILALLATSLLSRRDFRTYLISCEMPKPSSALLMPLERPG